MIYELVLRNFNCSLEFVFSLLLLQPSNFSPVSFACNFQDWGCVILREIDFLLKICWSIPCLHPSWKVHTWTHLQVSQIPKIKSRKGTGTWNPSRMTTFQGQSAQRHLNKKKWKNGQNQPNAMFIFLTFRNHRQRNFILFHIYMCRRFLKSNQKRHRNLQCQQNDHILR